MSEIDIYNLRARMRKKISFYLYRSMTRYPYGDDREIYLDGMMSILELLTELTGVDFKDVVKNGFRE